MCVGWTTQRLAVLGALTVPLARVAVPASNGARVETVAIQGVGVQAVRGFLEGVCPFRQARWRLLL